MDPELADLVPLFAEEVRERLERLEGCIPRLESDGQAMVEAKRELHTIKGAGRMLQLGAVAELCHAAEELLASPRPGLARLMTRVVDRLAAMVGQVAAGGEPVADGELLAILGSSPAVPSSPPPPPDPAPAAPQPPAAISPPAPAAKAPPSAARAAGARPAGTPPSEPAVRTSSGSASPASTTPSTPAAPAARGAPAGDVRVDAAALDSIAERATQVRIMALSIHPVAERIYELARLAEEGLREPQPKQVLAVLATMLRRVAVELEGGQRRLIRSSEEQLERMLALQLQPLRGFLLSLARYARDLARSLGREVEVEMTGEETRLDRRITRELEEAVLHLIRNAVDHGIESPEAREASGKPRAGTIRLEAAAEGPRVRLAIRDDGAGIDPRKVVERAVREGLVEAGSAATLEREDAHRLLFTPGFSTRTDVSEISGRGVGLDVVATAVNRVGGEVFLDSEPGEGTCITLEVPVARRGEVVMLLQVGDLKLAVPASAVKRCTRIETAEVLERDGRSIARVGDRLVPFVPLARLYGQPPHEHQLLLEGTVSGHELALAVDEVLGEHEVLVRPLAQSVTRAVASDRLLEGLALLATGEPVGVLSPAVLAQREYLRAMPVVREAAPTKRVRVLLVDDSLVTREMERRLLEDAGFEVAAVADAGEALSRLGEGSFECVVTDIEMPGMDGFELTAQLRGMEHFAHLPIVVVSTRDRPEDRLKGLKAGADAYLTKQSLDAGELVDWVRRLGGR